MPITCNVIGETISPPAAQIPSPNNWPSSAITEPIPFTMYGSPVMVPPNGVKGLSMKREFRDISGSVRYYGESKLYYDVFLETSNIITENINNTTVRYEGFTFYLTNISFHRNIWCAKEGTPVQVSMLFLTDKKDKMFHICIPVEYTVTDQGENLFLKKWLGTSYSETQVPPNITYNELINVQEDIFKFTIFNYCLSIKEKNKNYPYIFVLLAQPIRFNITKAKDWLRKDPYLQTISKIPTRQDAPNVKYPINTFDEIFNILFDIRNKDDPVLITGTSRTTTITQSSVLAAYYKFPMTDFIGTTLPSTLAPSSTTVSEENIKCYPLDVVRDVKADGSISIDRNTKKPIAANEFRENLARETGVNPILASMASNTTLEQLQLQHTLFYFLFLIFFSFFLIVGVIVLLVYIFQGSSEGVVQKESNVLVKRMTTVGSVAAESQGEVEFTASRMAHRAYEMSKTLAENATGKKSNKASANTETPNATPNVSTAGTPAATPNVSTAGTPVATSNATPNATPVGTPVGTPNATPTNSRKQTPQAGGYYGMDSKPTLRSNIVERLKRVYRHSQRTNSLSTVR